MKQNLIGNVYGDWVVTSEGRARGPNGVFRFWVCKCKCGFERTFHTSYLNTGQATCCDLCKEKKRIEIDALLEKDIVGKKYGSYTVVKYIGKNKYGSREWLCRCDCGKERKFFSAYLFGNGERRATTCMKNKIKDAPCLEKTCTLQNLEQIIRDIPMLL